MQGSPKISRLSIERLNDTFAQCQRLEGALVFAEQLLPSRPPAGAIDMFPIQHILHNQDENYLLSHILGLAALSLLRVSNTIGNDNIVKVCFWDIQHPTEIQFALPTSTSFSGLWGRRGGAHPVLESRRELRQEGRGPRGDGPHCGIGPSLFGPILSNKWPWFWSRRLLNKF